MVHLQVCCQVHPTSPLPPKALDLCEYHDPTRPGQGGHMLLTIFDDVLSEQSSCVFAVTCRILQTMLKKVIAKTEAPVICCIKSETVSVVGYRCTLVSCSSSKEAVLAVMSMYFVYNIV